MCNLIKGLKPAGKGLYKCNNLGPKALGYLGQPPQVEIPMLARHGKPTQKIAHERELHYRKPHSNGYYKFGEL
jgi:hypothetical protein